MDYSLRVFKIGEAMPPGPISFYLSHWDSINLFASCAEWCFPCYRQV